VWLFTVRQLIGEVAARLRYRSGMPGPHDWRPRGRYRLPVEGVWTVANGGPDPETSHSWSLVGQRYALDLVVTDGAGRTAPPDVRRPEEYFAWGRPILAAADGTVVAVRDGHHDSRGIGIIDPLARDPLGNFVVIEHAPGEYSLSAHLQCGSVTVRPGQRVQAGAVIGRCGHSGHSTEPHLHWQLMDRADFWRAASLPVRFAQYWRERDGRWELVSEAMPVRGERVSDRAPNGAENGRARETPGGAAVDHESGDEGRSALGGSAGRQ
jgi:murein DD-endopeptidase MepM/ murein hydrolase activator NlpD